MSEKMTLGVIFGGVSSEHDISCVSAKSIIKNLDYSRFNVVLIGITKQGRWFLYNDDINLLENDKWLYSKSLVPAFISPDTTVHGIVTSRGEVIRLDVVFPVLHGKNGEDGTVQGLLQLAQIPFVGCDATSSGVCMDKAFTNCVLDKYSISQAKWLCVYSSAYNNDPESVLKEAGEKLGYPIFVKPANAGSSVGISKASNEEELKIAIAKAFKEDRKAVLEEFVDGDEVECAVMGNDDPIAAGVGQIVAAADFYDYDAKYNNPQSQLFIPARISDEAARKIMNTAIKAYKILGCAGMARIDFFVRKSDGEVLLNEVNTIPGQTPISMYPKLFEAAGVTYPQLINKLLDYALERGGII